jgi:D-alanine-D-alanine ligase
MNTGSPTGTPNSNFSDDTYAEWDSFETIDAIREAISVYHDVTLIEADEKCFNRFIEVKPDIVFNISEGKNGRSREAQIPAILEMLNIPYTGSDPWTLTTCLDKQRTKEFLTYHKIPTPKFLVVNSDIDLENFSLSFPVIIKPIAEGSSKGIFNSSIFSDFATLKTSVLEKVKEYDQPFLIEEFLDGREFTVGILGNSLNTVVLPIVEINFESLPSELNPIYSYEAKWIYDTTENPLDIFSCPANLTKELSDAIKETALRSYNLFNCKDWCRIDIRLDKNKIPNVIELNPLPGVLPDPKDNSCLPKAARTFGLSYSELINSVLNFAIERNKLA